MAYNFSFGGSGQSTGFSFGQSTNSAPSSSATSSTFSSSTNTGGPFTFGAKPTASVTASNFGGFSFGQHPVTSQAPSLNKGFSFGEIPKTTTPAQSASGRFSFGSSSGLGPQGLTGTTASSTANQFTLSTPLSISTTSFQPVGQSTPAFGFGSGGLIGGSKPLTLTSQVSDSTAGFQLGVKSSIESSETTSLKLSAPLTTQAPQTLSKIIHPSATTSSGLSFGVNKPAFSLAGTSTQSTTSQLTLGFSTQQTTQSSTQATPSVTTTPFGFAGAKLRNNPVSSAPTPASGGFSLGGTTSSSSGTVTTTLLASAGLKFSSSTTSTASVALESTTNSASTSHIASSSVPSTLSNASAPSLRYSDLEGKVNSWMNVLEQQEKLFLTQATHVNAWGKLLIENADKITYLNTEFDNVELNQKRLSEELDYIKTQQEELESLLKPLEENTKQQTTSVSSSIHTHHADIERERTYNLAENIDSQLKNMVQDLREVVDHINLTSAPADANNPIVQIGKILSAHMDSLQWLDSNSVTLQHKVQGMTKQIDTMKKEQESKFRLAFN